MIDEVKMKLLMEKWRKSVSPNWKQFLEAITIFGGWDVEPIIGVSKKGVEYWDSPDGSLAGAEEMLREMKKKEVSSIPSSWPRPDEDLYMDLEGPLESQGTKKGFFLVGVHLRSAPGYKITDPKGHHFNLLPGRFDREWSLKGITRNLNPDFTRWLATESIFKAQVNEYLQTEAFIPGAKRTRENTGTCPCCFRNIKLVNNKMVMHGYVRPGHGYLQGSCFGVSYEAFELSPVGTKEYKEALETQLSDTKKSIEKTLSSLEPIWTRDGKKITTDNPRYEQAKKNRIASLEQDVRFLTQDIKVLSVRIEKWKLMPLPEAGQWHVV